MIPVGDGTDRDALAALMWKMNTAEMQEDSTVVLRSCEYEEFANRKHRPLARWEIGHFSLQFGNFCLKNPLFHEIIFP